MFTHRQQGSRLNVALVVSIGCGVYPAEALGKVDAHQFLFFGKHWLKAGYEIKKRAKNLLSLLSMAVSSSLPLMSWCIPECMNTAYSIEPSQTICC